LLSLTWIAVRLAVKRFVGEGKHSLSGIQKLLDAKYSVDRVVLWIVLGFFALLSIYGAISGVTQELAFHGSDYQGWNIANFPHQEAFSIGSWIVLGLITITMLATAWERRQSVYIPGGLIALSTAIPLLAGRFETQLATATAWRFLAAVFFLLGSLLLW